MQHAAVRVPDCDVLVHAGDFTRRGTAAEALEFLDWMAQQSARAKLVTAGNHDRCVERDPEWFAREASERGITALLDAETSVSGVRFWASPITPNFRNMAFNRDRGPPIRRHWELVPSGVDVLVTHGPPRGIGDRMFLGAHVGCDDLKEQVERIAPRLHVFGHIHEAFGEYRIAGLGTRFLNVACARFLSYGRREAVVIEL